MDKLRDAGEMRGFFKTLGIGRGLFVTIQLNLDELADRIKKNRNAYNNMKSKHVKIREELKRPGF
jgi:hypothetical protein